MSLIDSEIEEIFGKESKHNWKEYFRGIKPSLDLKDQNKINLGKLQTMDKKNNLHTLYHPDGTIWLQFNQHGAFNVNFQILDSENNFFAKTNKKTGLSSDRIWMENSRGEKILECKSGFTIPIWDQDEKPVAELKLKRFKNEFTLRIINPKFDKLKIIGFSLALVINQYYAYGGGGGAS